MSECTRKDCRCGAAKAGEACIRYLYPCGLRWPKNCPQRIDISTYAVTEFRHGCKKERRMKFVPRAVYKVTNSHAATKLKMANRYSYEGTPRVGGAEDSNLHAFQGIVSQTVHILTDAEAQSVFGPAIEEGQEWEHVKLLDTNVVTVEKFEEGEYVLFYRFNSGARNYYVLGWDVFMKEYQQRTWRNRHWSRG